MNEPSLRAEHAAKRQSAICRAQGVEESQTQSSEAFAAVAAGQGPGNVTPPLAAPTPPRRRCPALRLMGTAYHEAAHAVVAFSLFPPIPVEYATIVPDEYALGRVTYGEREDGWQSDTDSAYMAMCLLAEADTVRSVIGEVAECRFERREHRRDWMCTPDYEDALDDSTDTWDADESINQRFHVNLYEGQAAEHLDEPDIWTAIALTAGALLRKQTISGAEVRAIVDELGIEALAYRLPLFHDNEPEDEEEFSWSRW